MKKLTISITLLVCLAAMAFGQAPPPAAAPPAAAAPPPAAPAAAPVMITDQDVKGLSGPDAKARANGDPDGGLTGTINDITIADPVTDNTPKPNGLTLGNLAYRIGQHQTAQTSPCTLAPAFSATPITPAF